DVGGRLLVCHDVAGEDSERGCRFGTDRVLEDRADRWLRRGGGDGEAPAGCCRLGGDARDAGTRRQCARADELGVDGGLPAMPLREELALALLISGKAVRRDEFRRQEA